MRPQSELGTEAANDASHKPRTCQNIDWYSEGEIRVEVRIRFIAGREDVAEYWWKRRRGRCFRLGWLKHRHRPKNWQ